MTINAPAALLLLLYELVAEGQGVSGEKLRGTVQNDVLKEYVARGNYIFPPRPSMRLATDLFAYCAERLPAFNTISISGYHIREAGASAAQELAFTLANGIAYCEAAVAAGLSPDDFGERLSFFFNAHNHFFQEVAKFRAARRLWAEIMRDRFGATNPRALALRFHAQTGGSTLTAQQPENNIVRVAIQALSAVCGRRPVAPHELVRRGARAADASTRRRSRCARSRSSPPRPARPTPPTRSAARTSSRRSPTSSRSARASSSRAIDELGGAVAAIEQGFVQAEIEASAFRYQSEVESGERVVVGVNAFTEDTAERVELLHVDPAIERRQRERTARVRAERDGGAAASALDGGPRVAETDANLLPAHARGASRVGCTVGEICGVLRELWGTYDAQHA